MVETMYLLRTPANRERLAKSRAEVLSGDLYEYELPIMKASKSEKTLRPKKNIATVKKVATLKKKAGRVVKRVEKKTFA